MKLLRLLALLLFSPCMSLAQNQPEAPVVTDALIQRAETGEAEAQWQLGECYRLGNGVAQNWETAVYWYEKSAAQQYVPAVHSLSMCLGDGLGVKRDVPRAMELARFGAEKGYVKSKIALAAYYAESDMESDKQKAYEIFSELAEQGESLAMRNLGVCYRDGIGVQKDMAQASLWLTKAAEAGEATAQVWLALEYKTGTNVPKDMQKTLFWLTKAAEQGNAEAQYFLGAVYTGNDGVAKNEKETLKWWTLAANQGHVEAMAALVCVAWNMKDYDLCVKYATMAAAIGNEIGQFFMFRCYVLGLGIEKNLEKAEKLTESIAQTRNPKMIADIAAVYYQSKNYECALKWAKKTIEYGDITGSGYLIVGLTYSNGLAGCECDYVMATVAFQKSANCGNAQALYALALMYANGCGVEKNQELAYKLMTEAADKGDTAASEWLIKHSRISE